MRAISLRRVEREGMRSRFGERKTGVRAHEMLGIMNYAKTTWYNNKKSWQAMVKRAMKADFSWRNSAKEYIDVYNRL